MITATGPFGFAAHEVGDGEGEHAVEDVDPDFLFGPVVHRGEGDQVAVFELREAFFDVGLGAVGGDHVGGRPVVAVGEQDPFAEVFVFEVAVRGVVGAPGQA